MPWRAPRCSVRPRRAASLGTALFLAALCLGQAPAARAAEPGDYRLVGHRGDAASWQTENTIPALARALHFGASAVEVDLRLTADRRVVLMHDATLDRTTTCSGPVAARTVRSLREHCTGVRGTPIPTLRGLLEWASHHEANLLMEIKTRGGLQWRVRDFRVVTTMVRRAGMADRVRYLSRRPVVLRRIELASRHNHTQYLAPGWRLALRGAGIADGVNLHASQATRARVRLLRARGAQVLIRSSTNPVWWQRAHAAGARGLVVGDVAAYAAWRRR